jgi:hypothetical protein
LKCSLTLESSEGAPLKKSFFLFFFLVLLRIRDSGILASPRRATEVTTPSSTCWGSALAEKVRSAVFAPWLSRAYRSAHIPAWSIGSEGLKPESEPVSSRTTALKDKPHQPFLFDIGFFNHNNCVPCSKSGFNITVSHS